MKEYKSSTCELQGLSVVDGVDGTEGSATSNISVLPDKNSNSWILAKEYKKHN